MPTTGLARYTPNQYRYKSKVCTPAFLLPITVSGRLGAFWPIKFGRRPIRFGGHLLGLVNLLRSRLLASGWLFLVTIHNSVYAPWYRQKQDTGDCRNYNISRDLSNRVMTMAKGPDHKDNVTKIDKPVLQLKTLQKLGPAIKSCVITTLNRQTRWTLCRAEKQRLGR